MGRVYPNISIKDKENLTYAELDVDSNSVLIPMVYLRSFYTEPVYDEMTHELIGYNVTFNPELPQPQLYTDYDKFIDDFATGGGEVAKPEEGESWAAGTKPRYVRTYQQVTTDGGKYVTSYYPDRAYLMARELLKQGLPVIIKPIIVPENQFEYYKSSTNDSIDGGTFFYDGGAGTDAIEGCYAEENSILQLLLEMCDPDTADFLDEFIDKNNWNVKFITSGGYATSGVGYYKATVTSEGSVVAPVKIDAIGNYLMYVAASRGDSVALLDLAEVLFEDLTITAKTNTQKALIDNAEAADTHPSFELGKCAAMFAPWCSFNITHKYIINNMINMPGSFAYLMAFADSVKSNANWFAASGAIRGYVPQMIEPIINVGEAAMQNLNGKDTSLKIRVNVVMNAGTYGYRVWGNKVFAASNDNSDVYVDMYQDFLNVRILVCDIKKQMYHAAMRVTFEPNDDITWVSFKSLANTLLDKMKSGRGIVWYKWYKEKCTDKATIKATLKVKPIEAVEAFDLTLFLTDEDVDLEEVE